MFICCLCFGGENSQQKMEEMKRREGHPGQQKRVDACKTIQCNICKQTFMGSSTEGDLKIHWEAKHPKAEFAACFPNWEEQKAKMAVVKAKMAMK